MQIGRLLGEGRVAQVFEVGADVVKLYAVDVGPEQAEHEAEILDVLRDCELTVPRSLGVVQVDGRWGLLMTRIPGRPLAERMTSGADDPGIAILANLHHRMHENRVTGLPRLKDRLADRIGRATLLTSSERAHLRDRLAALPDGNALCHGDFHPLNIMVDGDNAAIIDWLDATSGPPAADVGRTYLLALHNLPALAEPYLTARLAGAAFDHDTVMGWLPVLAAARLAENVPEEEAQLLALVRSLAGDI